MAAIPPEGYGTTDELFAILTAVGEEGTADAGCMPLPSPRGV
jgi:hypothetical protein